MFRLKEKKLTSEFIDLTVQWGPGAKPWKKSGFYPFSNHFGAI